MISYDFIFLFTSLSLTCKFLQVRLEGGINNNFAIFPEDKVYISFQLSSSRLDISVCFRQFK